MIIVTNKTNKPITRAAIELKPGENRFKDGELSAGKLAQIKAHPELKWVAVEDRPTKETKRGDKS